MKEFIKLHQDCIHGVLHGFDRVVFRGTLRSIGYDDGLGKYLNSQRIWLKDFDAWVQRCTQRLGKHIEAVVAAAGLKIKYLSSAGVSKEDGR